MTSLVTTDKHLSRILAILREVLSEVDCRVYLFGSRARGANRSNSDYDIGVEARGDITRRLSHARERLEASTIPITVDLVDLEEVPPTLRRRVREEGIELWRSSPSV